jgi:hypothetical protein
MELTDAARRDMALAAAVRRAAHVLNMALADAAAAGLLCEIKVHQPEVEGDEPPEIEVAIERA